MMLKKIARTMAYIGSISQDGIMRIAAFMTMNTVFRRIPWQLFKELLIKDMVLNWMFI